MTTIPTSADRSLALRLFKRQDLTESEQAVCGVIVLAASTGQPVLPETLARFHALSTGERPA